MPRAAYAIADGPPASLDLSELRALINADRARAGLPPMSARQARRHIEGYGIRLIQPRPRCKLIIDGDALDRSGLWKALCRRARREAEEVDDDADEA